MFVSYFPSIWCTDEVRKLSPIIENNSSKIINSGTPALSIKDTTYTIA